MMFEWVAVPAKCFIQVASTNLQPGRRLVILHILNTVSMYCTSLTTQLSWFENLKYLWIIKSIFVDNLCIHLAITGYMTSSGQFRPGRLTPGRSRNSVMSVRSDTLNNTDWLLEPVNNKYILMVSQRPGIKHHGGETTDKQMRDERQVITFLTIIHRSLTDRTYM